MFEILEYFNVPILILILKTILFLCLSVYVNFYNMLCLKLNKLLYNKVLHIHLMAFFGLFNMLQLSPELSQKCSEITYK